jgi:hypothetical protein
MTTPLCKLAELYRVDKTPSILHDYTPSYNEVLYPLKEKINTVLEIGIGYSGLMSPICGNTYKHGASLRMWRDYFPNAHIIGCDIMESVIFNDENRITTFIANQSDKESLLNLVNEDINPESGYIDLIIDDGSHSENDQRISFETLWQFLRPNGGIYIIEDIWVGEILDRMANLPSILGFNDAKLVKKYDGKKDYQGFVIFKKIVL